jgi:dTDP-4-amino-4,6-dideoxygalactose transaminase
VNDSPPALVPCADPAADHQPFADELIAAAARVIRSGRYILGPEVEAFERELAQTCGVGHAIGMSSGTDALLAMLAGAGVGPGDEVVTSPFSFFATAGAILRCGARPVFADVDAATFNLDPAAAIAKLGPRTKAVLVVHIFGRCLPTTALEHACATRGIALLEDAAQAIGAVGPDGRRVGARTSGAALSFFPTKNLGGLGDGGAVLTDDASFAATMRRLRVHGADRKNHHVDVGGNFRLDALQAALLRVKLPRLSAWTAARRRAAARYRAGLRDTGLGLPPDDPGCVWNQFVVRVPEGRDRMLAELSRAGVASEVYYPTPLHLQPALRALGHAPGQLPIAERACAEVLALPIHPSLADASIERVITAVRASLGAR